MTSTSITMEGGHDDYTLRMVKLSAGYFISNDAYLERPHIVIERAISGMSITLSGLIVAGYVDPKQQWPSAICTHHHGGAVFDHFRAMGQLGGEIRMPVQRVASGVVLADTWRPADPYP